MEFVYCCFYMNGPVVYFYTDKMELGRMPHWTMNFSQATRFSSTKGNKLARGITSNQPGLLKGFVELKP